MNETGRSSANRGLVFSWRGDVKQTIAFSCILFLGDTCPFDEHSPTGRNGEPGEMFVGGLIISWEEPILFGGLCYG